MNSQENLYQLAKESDAQGKLEEAIQYLEDALRIGYSKKIAVYLSRLYCKNDQNDQAYSLIKEESDLFSDQNIFDTYCQILSRNNFFIEAEELQRQLNQKLNLVIEPVSESEQNKIMADFRNQKEVTLSDYQQLLKLNLSNFMNFAQSLLLDPTTNFAVRISLCEDLIRLKIDEEISVLVLGKLEKFIPLQTELMQKSPIYREIMYGVGDRYRNRPNQLPYVIGEVNLFVGQLYPLLANYISNTASFTRNMLDFIENRNGHEDQLLLEKIASNLPK
ncbi:hypothetical protein FC52_GL000355 [Lactobacillus pasteurii DSM 23907 = CRBIP 24.76]|uniref:TPR repeat-containing protein n=1 Tax=Lactobacillus pasteurii DSM 23907 = CRBIP 24.76 TaxID=1423790 RepID=I7LE15_9LACO|nr:hypothetical protein [Lactobacillus pasteurii]KRK08656.1 hypothetical protein FC52_GL000355 [Lactobacillus pasteurii DSM 23907 = CRBIP 24.76]TDG76520.1 hypothetical protein C5L33_001279 [Lactobacillus pasteurii]CCI85388.1 TPR repeat-containing protein [Lactobacillus pasteurii DSM 23907 = CRBIP 24.76]